MNYLSAVFAALLYSNHLSHVFGFVVSNKGYCSHNDVGLLQDTVTSSHVAVKSTKYDNDGGKESSSSEISDVKGSTGMPKITIVHGLNDFLDFLAESDDRLVVVEYYASWCKSCHKFGLKYKQLANKYADKVDKSGEIIQEGKVRFAQVEYGANVRLCKTMGIKKLPYVQMYKAPLGKISEFVCGPKFFDERLKTRLEGYLNMSDEEIKFNRDMEDGQVLGDSILEKVKEMALKEAKEIKELARKQKGE
jgi:thiol-disulfide isomerase/thioredoxin